MKLKDKLILRKVAGQNIIVPVGKRTLEVRRVVNISDSAAFLWDYMQKNEFTVDDLVKQIMEHYQGVTAEQAKTDIEKYMMVLQRNNMIMSSDGEESEKRGTLFYGAENIKNGGLNE